MMNSVTSDMFYFLFNFLRFLSLLNDFRGYEAFKEQYNKKTETPAGVRDVVTEPFFIFQIILEMWWL